MLADNTQLSFAELERKLNFSNGQIRRWDNAMPGSDKVQKVAEYFDVSTDYLLGLESYEKMKLDQARREFDVYEEQAVLMFRKQTQDMNDDQKRKFSNALNKLMDAAKDLIEDDSNWDYK